MAPLDKPGGHVEGAEGAGDGFEGSRVGGEGEDGEGGARGGAGRDASAARGECGGGRAADEGEGGGGNEGGHGAEDSRPGIGMGVCESGAVRGESVGVCERGRRKCERGARRSSDDWAGRWCGNRNFRDDGGRSVGSGLDGGGSRANRRRASGMQGNGNGRREIKARGRAYVYCIYCTTGTCTSVHV